MPVDYQNEWFDVVDRNDEVIGRERRPIVHRDGLLHRAVHGFVFNDPGHLFLQKRSMAKDNFPGTWDSSFSGHVDAGETYDQAVIREAHEEIGISLEKVPAKITKIDACQETGLEFTWLYSLVHNGPFVLHPQEIDEGRWVSIPDLEDWIQRNPDDFAPSFLCCWRHFKKLT